MKLSYRGNSYEPEFPDFEMREGNVAGKYRGQPWRQQYAYPRHIPVPQPSLNLQYRGVAYTTKAGLDTDTVTVTPAAHTQAQGLPSVVDVRRHVLEQLAATHRTNIQRSLERRMQVAKQQGNQALLNLLEKEFQQIA